MNCDLSSTLIHPTSMEASGHCCFSWDAAAALSSSDGQISNQTSHANLKSFCRKVFKPLIPKSQIPNLSSHKSDLKIFHENDCL